MHNIVLYYLKFFNPRYLQVDSGIIKYCCYNNLYITITKGKFRLLSFIGGIFFRLEPFKKRLHVGVVILHNFKTILNL